MSIEKMDKMIAFIYGDVCAMITFIIGGIMTDLGHMAIKIVSTIVVGIAGGFAGMVGKDLFSRYKNRKKKNNQNSEQ